MSLFSISALGATGLGAVAAGWIEENPDLQWRWIQWVSLMFATTSQSPFAACAYFSVLFSASGLLSVAVYLCIKETRAPVLLTRMAKKMRKETGDERYRSRAEDEMPTLRTLLMVSATRPICTLIHLITS